jgi:hypothetical protein
VPLHRDADLEALFQLPLDRFTAARNELAARLKAAGKADAAAAVKALGKPAASAWAANQVYWRDRVAFDELLRAGSRLLGVQRSGIGGDDLRDAIRERRAAVQAATRAAEEALVSGGHAPTPQVMRRVGATLEALAAGAGAESHGVLTEDLDAPGFDALAGLSLVPPPRPRPTLVPPPLKAAPAAAVGPAEEAAEEPAEKSAEEAARLAAEEKARQAADEVQRKRRAAQAAEALSVARERLEGSRRELDEAQRRLDRAKERVAISEKAVQDAERDVREAQGG